jgi:FKBP-type peptidyl-prolyl cis-trans isomerase
VDVAAPPANAKKTDKGVYYVVLNRGSGKQKPNAKSRVKVHYSGWTTDGKLFDSSVRRGKPALFPVGALIPGWVDVLQQMVVGDKWRIWIPEDLAYKGAAGAPEGMLVFEMELLEIVSL